ncbi:hypothetical protein PHMEG_00019468 [Phytophthora megakarya]|uniref:Uncharacterized protein n=1 Tax=Phytophthora megakarya TaxID=4795 RepID=A0A225VR93_9STRA|nr:hypothetical protein PHMEG_00019468 [Phytophthora megakarya]
MQMKVVERRSRCEACCLLDNCHSRARRDKRVTFDCSSLLSGRSKAFGSHGSRELVSNELFQYVYVISNPMCEKRELGLVEVFDAIADSEDKSENLPEGKRVIGSVGGIEAVSTGFIINLPTRINSTVRIRPGGQVLVVSTVLGHVSEDSTVLVEGWPELDETVRVARTLCLIYDMKVVVEMCNDLTEDVVIKKGTLVATVIVVPKSAFDSEDGHRNFETCVSGSIINRERSFTKSLDTSGVL